MITFRVYHKIKSKSRPRFNTKTGRAYKVKEDTLYENAIKNAYNASGGVKSDKYIKMTLDMYFAIPKSYTKKRKLACARNQERPAKKPDVDNVLKNVCDALNGVAYDDDIQVIEVICRKYYSQDEEYIEVRLEEIEWDISNKNILLYSIVNNGVEYNSYSINSSNICNRINEIF